jgi:hypothetical protein
MVKSLLPACLLILYCTVPSSAQVWSRAYGGPGSELGKFIEPASDGGFYVAGTQSTVQQGPERFYVARFDSNGTRLWEKTYGKAGMTHTLFAFSTTSDGGFMVGGFTGVQFSGTESALMYRADSNGTVVFENDVDYSDSDHWHLLLERPEGGYYMGGHTDSKGDSRGDMWLQKLDAQRQVIWEKVYNRNTGEHAHSGVITRDGGVMLLGHTEAGGREKYWAVKVDSAGAIQWQKVFGSQAANHDSPYKVFETTEGNFAFIGGSSDPNSNVGTMWLLVVDPDGGVVIDKHYGDAAAQTFSWSGRQTSDSGYILAGYTTYRTRGQTDLMVVKTDPQGNQEWAEKYGGTGYDYAFDVIEVPSGYIAAGYTGSSTIMTGGGGDLYVVKVAKRIVVAPAAVSLSAPANNAVNQPVDTRLRWAAAAAATRYEIQVATDSAFGSITHTDQNVAGTIDTALGLAGATQYYWRVRAINSAGAGPWSQIWVFTTALPLPAAVVLVSPASGSTVSGTSAELVWSAAVPAVDRYRVDLGPSATFTSWSSDTSITGTSTTLSGLEPGRTYWWRVKAHNGAGWGAFSEARSFIVPTTTSAPYESDERSLSHRVAPNPAVDRVTLRYTLAHGGQATIAIIDDRGLTLTIVHDNQDGPGERQQTIDLSSLPQGVYAVRIVSSTDGAVQTARVTVVR